MSKLEKSMEIVVEHSKMRKDASVLRKSGKISPDRQLFYGCFKNAQGCLNKKLRAFEKYVVEQTLIYLRFFF